MRHAHDVKTTLLPPAICHQSINPFKGLKSDTGMVVFTVVVVTIGSLQPTSTQLYT